jgi:NADPH:quinone reductase-like Zn-dependent oxidoreductase
MTAVRLHAFGGPEALVVEQVAVPEPGEGEVLVRVRAAGVNHLDLDIRAGTSRLPIRFPHVLGMEAAGEVAAVGAAVEGVAPGDRVAVLYQSRCGSCAFCLAGEHSLCPAAELLGVHRPGGYAEYAVAAAGLLVPLPEQVPFEDAAAVQLSFGTAWHALAGRARLEAGETVLVSAAGSGVGSAALQVARLLGARPVASVGSPEKAERARRLGAELVVDYASAPLAETVLAETGGVDVVLEHVGGALFGESLRCLRPGGRLVVLGAHAGEQVPVDLVELFRNQWSVIGSRRATEPELRHVFDLLGAGELRPTIHATLPLAQAAEAHALLAGRQAFGKVVLQP